MNEYEKLCFCYMLSGSSEQYIFLKKLKIKFFADTRQTFLKNCLQKSSWYQAANAV